MTIEQLLIFALLLGFPLIQRLVRALQRGRAGTGDAIQRRPQPAAARVPPIPHAPPQAAPAAPDPVPPPPAVQPAAPPPPHGRPVTARAVHARRPEPSRAPSRRRTIARTDLRRAVILMTILGPCRALQNEDPNGPAV